MLKPKELERLPNAVVELYSQVEIDALRKMAERINAIEDFIPASQWQYQKLIEMGNYHSYIVKALASMTGRTETEIKRLIRDAGQKTLKFDDEIYKSAGLSPPPLAASPAIQAVLEAGLTNTKGLFENLTRTTADTSTRQFERALDRAWLQVSTGAFSHQEAVRTAIKDLSRSGLASIEYPSGHVDYLDVAVRRAILTGVNQTALKVQETRADELGSDLVEVSAHAGARIGVGVANHAEWQGKVYSRSGTHRKYPSFVEKTGYGTGPGLGGWNCRHSFFPFFEGLSTPAYTKEELEELNAPKYDYNGKKLTEQEATDRQRYLERQIRRWKREKAAMKAAGLDTSESSAKLKQWQETQRDFLEQTGLKRQYDRERVEVLTSGNTVRAQTRVEKVAKSAILDEKDIYAINQYKSAKSYQINATLRGDIPMTGELQAMVDSIDKAIEKLPVHIGTVRRSITDFGIEDIGAFWGQYAPGKRVNFPAYTSSGTQVYDESFPIQYVILSKTGRDMREYNPKEFEVLFERGTEFDVSKVDGNTIYMEEV